MKNNLFYEIQKVLENASSLSAQYAKLYLLAFETGETDRIPDKTEVDSLRIGFAVAHIHVIKDCFIAGNITINGKCLYVIYENGELITEYHHEM